MKKIFRFSRYNTVGLLLSLVVTTTLVGITIYRGGFNLGVDFSSGQSVVVDIPQAESERQVIEALGTTFEKVSVKQQGNGANAMFNIKIASTAQEQEEKYTALVTRLQNTFTEVNVLSTSFIGARISDNLFRSSLLFVSIALGLILVYIWFRFKLQFALASILSLMHDAGFIIGIIGAFQIEVTVSTVAAVLAIIGYSLNDTIVIFDRIRENLTLKKDLPFTEITDQSISRTLSRTIITSLTTLLAVLAIFIFASGDVRNFALTLIIGILEGTWSSVFVATPIMYVLGMGKARQTQKTQSTNEKEGAIASVNPSKISTAAVSAERTVSSSYIDRVKAETLSYRKRKKKR